MNLFGKKETVVEEEPNQEQISAAVDELTDKEQDAILREAFQKQKEGVPGDIIANQVPTVISKKLDSGEPAGEPPAGKPPAGKPPAGEPPAGKPPAGEPPAGEPPAGKPPAGEPPAGEPPAGEPPSDVIPNEQDDPAGYWKAIAERNDKRTKDAQVKISEQGTEIADLRGNTQAPQAGFPQQQQPGLTPQQLAVIAQTNPALAQVLAQNAGLIPPQPIQQEQEEEYDFTKPESVDKRATKAAAKALNDMVQQGIQKSRANRINTIQSNFNAASVTGRNKLINDGVPTDMIDKSIADFQKQFSINPVGTVHKLMNVDALIQEAEKRGAEKAIKDMVDKTNQPKRLSNAASQKTTLSTKKNISEMSVEELRAHIRTLDPMSKEYEDIEKLVFKMNAKGL